MARERTRGPDAVGEVNRASADARATVARYARHQGWADDGERMVLNRIADEVRGRRVLDVGVGAGRTAWVLRLLTAEYVAIDVAPAMVEACRRRYPGLPVAVGDARDLRGFGDASFSLVLFSINGIDALDHDDRLASLHEFRRVLEPGGLLVYSTTSLDGPHFASRPWRVRELRHRVHTLLEPATGSTLRQAVEPVASFARSCRNWSRLRSLGSMGDGWAVGVHPADEFSVVLHFTRPATELATLESVGFAVEVVIAADGSPVTGPTTLAPWFHLVARARAL